jgi:hypothetical protein
MHIALLVPDAAEPTPSRLAAALRDAGHAAELITSPPAAALDALPEGAVPVIDSRLLPGFADCPARLAARGAVGLWRHAPDPAHDPLPAVRALRLVIASSESVAGRLTSLHELDPALLRVVAPGSDPAPRSPGSGGPTCCILAAGLAQAQAGHALLLRALARLGDLDWRLTIAGADDPAALQDLLAEPALAGRVGFIADAAEAWAGTDLFALAPDWDPDGAGTLAALRRGIPVAVTGGGAAGAAVTETTGVVTPPGDRDQLSKALRRLIFDDTLRASMAKAAWTLSPTLPDWPAQAHRLTHTLEK